MRIIIQTRVVSRAGFGPNLEKSLGPKMRTILINGYLLSVSKVSSNFGSLKRTTIVQKVMNLR